MDRSRSEAVLVELRPILEMPYVLRDDLSLGYAWPSCFWCARVCDVSDYKDVWQVSICNL